MPGLLPLDLDSLSDEKAKELLLRICSRIGEEAAAIARLCGNLPLALDLAARALNVREDLSNLGIAYGQWGEDRRAIEYHELALHIFEEIGDRRRASEALVILGRHTNDWASHLGLSLTTSKPWPLVAKPVTVGLRATSWAI